MTSKYSSSTTASRVKVDAILTAAGMAEMFGQLRKCPHEIWFVYVLKCLEATAFYSTTFVLTKYLTDELKMSDTSAGWLFGFLGVMTSMFGFLSGFIIDNIGVRRSLMLGCCVLLIARSAIAFSTSPTQVALVLLSFYPAGSALIFPVLIMALRRYTKGHVRQFAFSAFYICMNLSGAIAAFLINRVRVLTSTGVMVLGRQLSMYRMVFLVGVTLTVAALFVSTQIREIHVGDEGEVRGFVPRRGWVVDIASEVAGQAKFWRFAAVSLLFAGVRSNFLHIEATFPKYFTREFGDNSSYELLMSINPVLIVVLVPLATYGIHRADISFRTSLIFGALVSGASPLFLAASNSMAAAVAWMVLLSLGESIWAPKLLEYGMSVAPVGREGTYTALVSAPLFLARFCAGGLGGVLLEHYCPAEGPRHPQTMWAMISVSTFVPTVLLAALHPWLLVPTDVEAKDLPLTSARYGSLDGGEGLKTAPESKNWVS